MYAITKYSRRARAQAVACDLVRVVLRAENLLSAERHNAAVRDRLSAWSADYLVTEIDGEIDGWLGEIEKEVEADNLPVWREFETGRVVWLGGKHHPSDMREGFELGRADFMDATERIPAGATGKYITGANEVCAASVDCLRPGWFE